VQAQWHIFCLICSTGVKLNCVKKLLFELKIWASRVVKKVPQNHRLNEICEWDDAKWREKSWVNPLVPDLDYRSGLIIQFVESNDVIGKRLNQDLSLSDLMLWMVELGKVALLFMCLNRIRCWVLAWHMVEYYMDSRLINFMGIDSSHGDP